MNKIKCPNCEEYFEIDESKYSEIVEQIKTKEFEKELNKRIDLELNSKLVDKNLEIEILKTELKNSKEKTELTIKNKDNEKNIEIESLRKNFELEKQQYENEIERLKDFKAKQSTKMVGESLEKYCETEFNKIRATAFKNAYFEKDTKGKTKGDYIYRESIDGIEYISIMFEMKNESDTTKNKKKNENFFEKLDKDRKKKNCEYAILVSTLESDNEYYNTGIVDVSHKYEKMYVIRPQFFIPIITILKNSSSKSLEYRKDLEIAKNQNIDITNFEKSMNDFKDKFNKNFQNSKETFYNAIKEIDKSIESLTKIKKNLLSSEENLKLTNNLLGDLNIKKITENNPTMKSKFDELNKTTLN